MPLRAYPEQAPTPERLAETHLNLARKIAWHIHGRTGQRVEIEDLLQVAHLGLIEAARRYVPQPGVAFAAYAAIRIRGALMDHLRGLAQQARGVLAMQGKIRAAERRLEQALMRSPTAAELAADLDMAPGEYARWRMEIDSARVDSLDDIYTDQSLVFRDAAPGADEQLERAAMKRLLRDAVARLPEREALVLQLYYVEELNVFEVAEVLKVTTGRVSQIKKAAIERLRRFIAEADGVAA
jgi:RNA polymerase sigma factor for flagellar operon FliA